MAELVAIKTGPIDTIEAQEQRRRERHNADQPVPTTEDIGQSDPNNETQTRKTTKANPPTNETS